MRPQREAPALCPDASVAALLRAVDIYQATVDSREQARLVAALTGFIEWLCDWGYGDVSFHAVNHRLGAHYTERTITKTTALNFDRITEALAQLAASHRGHLTYEITVSQPAEQIMRLTRCVYQPLPKC